MTTGRDSQPAKAATSPSTLLSGAELWRALGYRSDSAFRIAVHRQSVPVRVFDLPHRRGKFALRRDVDAWLESLSNPAVEVEPASGPVALAEAAKGKPIE